MAYWFAGRDSALGNKAEAAADLILLTRLSGPRPALVSQMTGAVETMESCFVSGGHAGGEKALAIDIGRLRVPGQSGVVLIVAQGEMQLRSGWPSS